MSDEIGPPWWDKPVYLVGGGPSLKGFDFGRLAGLDAHIVGVNRAMFDAPCCAGVTVDPEFVGHLADELATLAKSIEIIVAEAYVPGAVVVERRIGGGLSTDPHILMTCGSSGYAAINAAVLKRAKEIVLLGYDYSLADGHHYHDAYPWFRAHHGFEVWAQTYESMLPELALFGVTVINASPHSAIPCFPKVSLDDALTIAHPRPAGPR